MVKGIDSVLLHRCSPLFNLYCTSTASANTIAPFDCSDISNTRVSGVYTIYPFKIVTRPVQVYCEYEQDGEGWTVIQKRFKQSVPFNRTWDDYKLGFGSASDEYWLGNDVIHELTSSQDYEIMMNMSDYNGVEKYAKYDSFWIDDGAAFYKLHVRGYSGTAGNDLAYNNGANFSTFDQDHSIDPWNACARSFGAGWWFAMCSRSGLNEPIIRWFAFHNVVPPPPLKTSLMMVRKRTAPTINVIG